MLRATFAGMLAGLIFANHASAVESTCYGTPSNGRLEHGVQLPVDGPNFQAYSSLAHTLGRTYVHSEVAMIVLAAYTALATAAPDKVFMYGETGWKNGGRLKPHRTHKNGLSVDFFVPVIDEQGKSVHLPTGISNKYGYEIEFDASGRFEKYRIDFEALAEHLYQLDVAAKAKGRKLALVIIDPPYKELLFKTRRGAYLQSTLNFMKGKAWVRHDEHYHVDFAISCKP